MAMALVILLSFSTLGIILFMQVYNYSASEKKQSLTKACEKVVSLTDEKYLSENIQSFPYEIAYRNMLLFLADNYESMIFVADPEGNIVYFSDGMTIKSGQTVGLPALSKTVVNEILSSKGLNRINNLGGFLEIPEYTVGMPVISGSGGVLNVVIISSNVRNLAVMFNDMIGKFMLTALLVILFAFLTSWMIASSMSRPLRQMRNAARSFARGNFDVRLTVDGKDEIAELAEAFNNMAFSLTKLEALRSDFIANVSHEMKTPMTTISGFIDGILDGTIPADRQNHYLEIIAGEIRRLSRLVGKTLFVSRLQSGTQELKLTSFDLAQLVSNTALSFEQKISQKNLSVNLSYSSASITVTADSDAITQVVTNLIDNAVKYASDGGRIEVTLIERDKKAHVTVGNTGDTIPADDLPFIFDRFFKADRSRSSDTSSYGLGLFISKTIINQHGDDLRVTSENGFTEFTFGLTLAD